MMPRLAVVALSAMALLAPGCGDDSEETSASGGGSAGNSSSAASASSSSSAGASSSSSSTSSSSSSSGTAGNGGDACNDLTQQGEVVVAVADVSPPPSPTGGDIVDGVYVLTSLAFLESDSVPIPLSTATTAEVVGLEMHSVTTDAEGVATHATASLEVAGVALKMIQTCSSPPSEQVASDFTFTATPTELWFYASLGGIVIEQRYTKAEGL